MTERLIGTSPIIHNVDLENEVNNNFKIISMARSRRILLGILGSAKLCVKRIDNTLIRPRVSATIKSRVRGYLSRSAL